MIHTLAKEKSTTSGKLAPTPALTYGMELKASD